MREGLVKELSREDRILFAVVATAAAVFFLAGVGFACLVRAALASVIG